MTAPINLWKVRLVAAGLLIPIIGFVFPHAASAQTTSEGKSLVFELKPNVLNNNQTGLTIAELADYDAFVKNEALVKSVQAYLEAKRSPLAPYASQIIKLNNWEQAMGIIFVESNYCTRAKNFNCGSVGVGPSHKSWKKFTNPYDGFKAVADLLDKPLYKNRYNTCKEKIGVYVVPGSASWLKGCESVEKHMKELIKAAEQERQMHMATTAPAAPVANREIAMAR